MPTLGGLAQQKEGNVNLKFEEIVELIHREMYVRNGVMLGSKAAAKAILQAEEAAQQGVQLTGLCVCSEYWSIDIHGNCSNCGLAKSPRN